MKNAQRFASRREISSDDGILTDARSIKLFNDYENILVLYIYIY